MIQVTLNLHGLVLYLVTKSACTVPENQTERYLTAIYEPVKQLAGLEA